MFDFVAVLMKIRRHVAAHGLAHSTHVRIDASDMAVVQIRGGVVGHPI